MSPDKLAREQRIDAACDAIETVLAALPDREASEVIVWFSAGYLFQEAEKLTKEQPRLDLIRAGRIAVEAFAKLVTKALSELIADWLKDRKKSA